MKSTFIIEFYFLQTEREMSLENKYFLSLIAMLMALLLIALPAAAEDAQKPITLEPVKITAQKREEDVQDIPGSVDVLSSETIQDAGITNMEDMYLHSPNLYRSGSYVEHNFVIRGITTFTGSITPNAPLYVDDVPLPLHYAHNLDLMDIERIEVLKGPQGTLYGMNSESGVINVITKKPDNAPRSYVFGEYGTANTSRVGGYTSFPIVEDTWYARIALQQDKTDGHVTNIFNDNNEATSKEHRNMRGTLRWTPNQAWDISLSADYMHADDNIMEVRATEGVLATAGYLESDYDDDLYAKQEGHGFNLTAKKQGDNFDFLSVTGVRGYRNSNFQDRDVSSSQIYYYGESKSRYNSTIYSQEFRLSSPENSGRFKWLTGLYGYHDQMDIAITDYMLQVNPNPMSWVDNDITKNGVAIFGEGTYALRDDLRLTLGLRAAYDVIDGKHQNMDGVDLSDTLRNFELLPKAALAYDLTDTAMAYASVTRGFLSGGFNYFSAIDNNNYSYDPERTWNYEIGLKTSLFDNRMTTNLSAFYISIEDKQVVSWYPVSNKSEILNAAKAHTLGAELEVTARPAQGWQLFGGLGVIKAKLDDCTLAESAGGSYNYSGNRLPDVPSYTFNLGAQYNHTTGFFGRADLLGVGDFTGDLKNKSKESGYKLVNLRIGKEWEHGRVYAWCNNLFNERYHKSVFAWDMTGNGDDRQAIDGDPRTFGIGGSLSF